MGDEDDRLAAAFPQPDQLLLQQDARLRVQRRERFVHQQDRRIDGERAGHADALLHAARELVRIQMAEAIKTHRADIALRHRARGLLRQALGARPISILVKMSNQGSRPAC